MRKMADCRRFESETNCSLTIIGEEDEVVEAAAQHAASVHGHQDTPEFRVSCASSSNRRRTTSRVRARLSSSQPDGPTTPDARCFELQAPCVSAGLEHKLDASRSSAGAFYLRGRR